MTAKEVYEASKEWDLTSHAACLAFSDWLLEHDEVKWANLVRWGSHYMFVYNRTWGSALQFDLTVWLAFKELISYPVWRGWADCMKVDTIPDQLQKNPL